LDMMAHISRHEETIQRLAKAALAENHIPR